MNFNIRVRVGPKRAILSFRKHLWTGCPRHDKSKHVLYEAQRTQYSIHFWMESFFQYPSWWDRQIIISPVRHWQYSTSICWDHRIHFRKNNRRSKSEKHIRAHNFHFGPQAHTSVAFNFTESLSVAITLSS